MTGAAGLGVRHAIHEELALSRKAHLLTRIVCMFWDGRMASDLPEAARSASAEVGGGGGGVSSDERPAATPVSASTTASSASTGESNLHLIANFAANAKSRAEHERGEARNVVNFQVAHMTAAQLLNAQLAAPRWIPGVGGAMHIQPMAFPYPAPGQYAQMMPAAHAAYFRAQSQAGGTVAVPMAVPAASMAEFFAGGTGIAVSTGMGGIAVSTGMGPPMQFATIQGPTGTYLPFVPRPMYAMAAGAEYSNGAVATSASSGHVLATAGHSSTPGAGLLPASLGTVAGHTSMMPPHPAMHFQGGVIGMPPAPSLGGAAMGLMYPAMQAHHLHSSMLSAGSLAGVVNGASQPPLRVMNRPVGVVAPAPGLQQRNVKRARSPTTLHSPAGTASTSIGVSAETMELGGAHVLPIASSSGPLMHALEDVGIARNPGAPNGSGLAHSRSVPVSAMSRAGSVPRPRPMRVAAPGEGDDDGGDDDDEDLDIDSMAKRGRETKTASEQIPDEALSVLFKWLVEHIAWPFPDKRTKDQIASEAGLEPIKVKYWFANMRKRHWVRVIANGEEPRSQMDLDLLKVAMKRELPVGAGKTAFEEQFKPA